MRLIYRELNLDAGSPAGRRETAEVHHETRPFEFYRLHVDGSHEAGRGLVGAGWLLGAGNRRRKETCGELPAVGAGRAHGSDVLSSSSTQAEVHASRARLGVFFSFVRDRVASDAKRAAMSCGGAVKARHVSEAHV